jgi:DNA-binding SARP family transcriptional activator
MDRLVERKRLVVRLDERHQLAIIAVVAPAGFGKSVLLEQALALGPSKLQDRDLIYQCTPEDSGPGQLARALIRTSRGEAHCDSRTRLQGPDSSSEDAKLVAEALDSRRAPGGHIALIIDNLEKAGPDGAALLRALLDRMPARCHLVVSSRHMPRIGLVSHIAAGSGLLIGAPELAFRPEELSVLGDLSPSQSLTNRELATWPAIASLILKGHEDLIAEYISEMVLADHDEAVGDAVAAIASVGGCQSELLVSVTGAVLDDDSVDDAPSSASSARTGPVIDTVTRLPLMDTRGGIWPHPIWSSVTESRLTPDLRERVVLAKVRGLLQAGEIHDAGSQAITSRISRALSLVVRSALSSQPPKASVADLRAWASSDLMSKCPLELEWLRAIVDLQLGDADGTGRRRLEDVRRAFEDTGDEEAEISVLSHLGVIARVSSDSVSLASLLERGAVLASGSDQRAQGLVALGRALAAQMAGDPKGAIAALEQIPPGSLTGEWASQALMMRGTNLLLAGRAEEALMALQASTGEGTEATRSIAHDLLSTARWYSGDPSGAIEDSVISESLAVSSGTSRVVQQRRAWIACLLAASGEAPRARHVLGELAVGSRDSLDDETQALMRITEVLLLAGEDKLEDARPLLEQTKVPTRPTRSAVWTAALDVALGLRTISEPPRGSPRIPATHGALAAGIAAADHLAGGAVASRFHRAYLPARWCEPENTIAVKLAGSCTVTKNGRPVEHPAWARTRVRELCLHLALAENKSRSLVASALWPDLPDKDAGRNLRVTLTHLLDVIEPERSKASRSRFIVETDGSLLLSRTSGLRVDLWDLERHADAVLALPDHERPAMLAHARRMVAFDHGPLLSGAGIGEWVEQYRRRRDELRISASLRAGRQALAAPDNKLAGALGLSALDVDPWSEQAHSLVIESRINSGDLDGARRAFKRALAAFDDLGVSSGLATSALLFRLGL